MESHKMRLSGLLLLLLPLVDSSTTLTSNQHGFADKFVDALYEEENECSSSLGVSMAFSLIYPSADTANQVEMQDVFGFPSTESHRQLLWNATQTRLNESYDGKCLQPDDAGEEAACEIEEATLKIANRVWLSDSLIVSDEYSDLLGPYLFQLDFNSGDAGSVVNQWVSDSTHGRVKSILPDGPLAGIVVAVNTIYLKAAWMQPFVESMTNLDSFYSSSSRTTALPSQVNFMHTVNNFPYSDTVVPGYQILQLRFRGTMSMILALPVSEDAVPVDFQEIQPLVAGMESTKVAVALPKFRIESVYNENLKNALQSMGLESTFQGGFCFGGEGGCNGRVSSVIQKTVINLNENGVEAAAATALGDRSLPVPAVPVLFLANHPFQFFIYESEEDVVLFEGRVANPGVTYDVEPPSLDAQHNDVEFWIESFNVDPRSPMDDSSTNSLSPWMWSSLAIFGMAVLVF